MNYLFENMLACYANCFECGLEAEHEHHVVPRSKGGTKTVPLCTSCHGKVHGCKLLNNSKLIKDALQAAKRRGVHLGNDGKYLTPAIRARGRKAGHASNALKARQAYADLLPTMQEWRKTMTLQTIADKLNDLGHTTRRGCPWSQVQVGRVLSYCTGQN